MASLKKKPSAKHSTKKPTAKFAPKAQPRSKTAAASSAQAAQRSGVEWVKNGAAEWQKGAQDWAKQSAKLYQLPFGQAEATDAAKKAAEGVQSATEGMMNFAQQMFNPSNKQGFSAESFNPSAMFKNAPNFNTQEAQEKFSSFARAATEQLNKSSGNTQNLLNEAMKLTRENGKVLVDVSNIAVSVSKELGAEYMNYLNKLFTQNLEHSKHVHNCRTLNDLFDLSSRVVKSNLDAFFSESVKLSEKMFQCATDVSEPLNERVSETSQRLSKAFSA